MRIALFVLLIAFVGFCRIGGSSVDYSQTTWHLLYEDSTRIDSTEVKWLPFWWQDKGAQKTFVFEVRDDSADGFANDSAAFAIEVYQGFPLSRGVGYYGAWPYMVLLKSAAHPDSSGSLLSGGTAFKLYDSLDISDMDTGCVYARNRIAVRRPSGDTTGYVYGDSVGTLQTIGYGAFAYRSAPLDATPGAAMKITGLSRNRVGGVGSFIRVRIYEFRGEAVVNR